jgi:hypothetical protein
VPSLIVDDRARQFHCLSCGAQGNEVDFVVRTEPELQRAILDWLGRVVPQVVV